MSFEQMRVRSRADWGDGGRLGVQIGPSILVGQSWTPVLWDGDEDPDFYKTAGLEQRTERWEPVKGAVE